MSAGAAKDSRGAVNMHVLRVDVSRASISLHPLMHSLAERRPLSLLAAGHPHLMAATNTGYFDFRSGAPTDPLIVHGSPLVITATHQPMVGIGANRRIESGHVWWSATITAGTRHHALVARNEVVPPPGITLYTAAWGSAPVPAKWNSVTRAVVNGVVVAGQRLSHWQTVPNRGSLLVANGSAAQTWLSAVTTGTKVSTSSSVDTDAATPFVQAYGVGVQVVATAGVVRSGFSCNSANTTQPARTEIGFANSGRTLVMAIVADHPGTSMHGLDEDQMSELMVQLGVSQAFAFDGSGSTELLARVPAHSGLTRENYPADGQERPMPVGLGIMSMPPKAKSTPKK